MSRLYSHFKNKIPDNTGIFFVISIDGVVRVGYL
nr:MAG TPA: hypothetical protein [Caudoviricetes sp.]